MASTIRRKNGTDSNKSIPSSAPDSNCVMIETEKSENRAQPNGPVHGCLTDNPKLNVSISNVVTNFDVKSHLNLRHVARNGRNVEYRRGNGMVRMQLRKPSATATIRSSGKIACMGTTSETDAKIASRRVARIIQKLGYHNVTFGGYRIVNVFGSCSLPFPVDIVRFSRKYRTLAQYEPELHPGVTFRTEEPKATSKIYSTGSVTVTAPSVANVHRAIEQIYAMAYPFRRDRPTEDVKAVRKVMTMKRSYPEIDENVSTDDPANSAAKRSRGGLSADPVKAENHSDDIVETEHEDVLWKIFQFP